MRHYSNALFIAAALLHGITVFGQLVVPNGYENKEGESLQGGSALASDDPLRYQMLYAASQFVPLLDNGGWIKGIAFRVNGSSGIPASANARDVEIHLSTSPKNPSTISPFYAANIGADEIVVLPTKSFTLKAVTATVPRPFELRIDFDTPFFYNPKAGSLLVDFFIHTGIGLVPALDAPAFPQDQVMAITVGDPNALTGNATIGGGVVTQFQIEAVPEPSVVVLFVLGVSLIALGRRKEASHV